MDFDSGWLGSWSQASSQGSTGAHGIHLADAKGASDTALNSPSDVTHSKNLKVGAEKCCSRQMLALQLPSSTLTLLMVP